MMVAAAAVWVLSSALPFGAGFGTLLVRILPGWEGAQDLLDDDHDPVLLVFGEAGDEVIDTGAQDGGVLRADVENHDHLALGEIIVAQLVDQTVDGEAIVGDGALAEGVGRGPEILDDLYRALVRTMLGFNVKAMNRRGRYLPP